MARNIEIKARVDSLEKMISKIVALGGSGPTKIKQDDTFFGCENGRLKLREFSPSEGELIFYQRADSDGPKESFYLRSQTNVPESLRELLGRANGVLGRVRKVRTLFVVGRTRIHLDRVEDLGEFLELEVVLAEKEDSGIGVAEARHLMGLLEIDDSQLVEGSYFDLLTNLRNQT